MSGRLPALLAIVAALCGLCGIGAAQTFTVGAGTFTIPAGNYGSVTLINVDGGRVVNTGAVTLSVLNITTVRNGGSVVLDNVQALRFAIGWEAGNVGGSITLTNCRAVLTSVAASSFLFGATLRSTVLIEDTTMLSSGALFGNIVDSNVTLRRTTFAVPTASCSATSVTRAAAFYQVNGHVELDRVSFAASCPKNLIGLALFDVKPTAVVSSTGLHAVLAVNGDTVHAVVLSDVLGRATFTGNNFTVTAGGRFAIAVEAFDVKGSAAFAGGAIAVRCNIGCAAVRWRGADGPTLALSDTDLTVDAASVGAVVWVADSITDATVHFQRNNATVRCTGSNCFALFANVAMGPRLIHVARSTADIACPDVAVAVFSEAAVVGAAQGIRVTDTNLTVAGQTTTRLVSFSKALAASVMLTGNTLAMTTTTKQATALVFSGIQGSLTLADNAATIRGPQTAALLLVAGPTAGSAGTEVRIDRNTIDVEVPGTVAAAALFLGTVSQHGVFSFSHNTVRVQGASDLTALRVDGSVTVGALNVTGNAVGLQGQRSVDFLKLPQVLSTAVVAVDHNNVTVAADTVTGITLKHLMGTTLVLRHNTVSATSTTGAATGIALTVSGVSGGVALEDNTIDVVGKAGATGLSLGLSGTAPLLRRLRVAAVSQSAAVVIGVLAVLPAGAPVDIRILGGRVATTGGSASVGVHLPDGSDAAISGVAVVTSGAVTTTGLRLGTNATATLTGVDVTVGGHQAAGVTVESEGRAALVITGSAVAAVGAASAHCVAAGAGTRSVVATDMVCTASGGAATGLAAAGTVALSGGNVSVAGSSASALALSGGPLSTTASAIVAVATTGPALGVTGAAAVAATDLTLSVTGGATAHGVDAKGGLTLQRVTVAATAPTKAVGVAAVGGVVDIRGANVSVHGATAAALSLDAAACTVTDVSVHSVSQGGTAVGVNVTAIGATALSCNATASGRTARAAVVRARTATLRGVSGTAAATVLGEGLAVFCTEALEASSLVAGADGPSGTVLKAALLTAPTAVVDGLAATSNTGAALVLEGTNATLTTATATCGQAPACAAVSGTHVVARDVRAASEAGAALRLEATVSVSVETVAAVSTAGLGVELQGRTVRAAGLNASGASGLSIVAGEAVDVRASTVAATGLSPALVLAGTARVATLRDTVATGIEAAVRWGAAAANATVTNLTAAAQRGGVGLAVVALGAHVHDNVLEVRGGTDATGLSVNAGWAVLHGNRVAVDAARTAVGVALRAAHGPGVEVWLDERSTHRGGTVAQHLTVLEAVNVTSITVHPFTARAVAGTVHAVVMGPLTDVAQVSLRNVTATAEGTANVVLLRMGAVCARCGELSVTDSTVAAASGASHLASVAPAAWSGFRNATIKGAAVVLPSPGARALLVGGPSGTGTGLLAVRNATFDFGDGAGAAVVGGAWWAPASMLLDHVAVYPRQSRGIVAVAGASGAGALQLRCVDHGSYLVGAADLTAVLPPSSVEVYPCLTPCVAPTAGLRVCLTPTATETVSPSLTFLPAALAVVPPVVAGAAALPAAPLRLRVVIVAGTDAFEPGLAQCRVGVLGPVAWSTPELTFISDAVVNVSLPLPRAEAVRAAAVVHRPTTVRLNFSRECFQRRSEATGSANATLLPVATDETFDVDTDAATAVTAVAASVLASVAAAAVPRVALVSSVAVCEDWRGTQPGFAGHPLRFDVGTAGSGAGPMLGRALGNAAVLFGLPLLAAVAACAVTWARAREGTSLEPGQAVAVWRVPSVCVGVWGWLLQPAVAALVALVATGTSSERFLCGVVLVVVLAAVGGAVAILTFFFDATFAPLLGVDDAARRCAFAQRSPRLRLLFRLSRPFSAPGGWADPPATAGFVGRWGLLFEDYSATAPWFMAVEAVAAVVLGVMQGAALPCAATAWIAALVCVVVLGARGLRPWRRPGEAVLDGVAALLTAAASVAGAVSASVGASSASTAATSVLCHAALVAVVVAAVGVAVRRLVGVLQPHLDGAMARDAGVASILAEDRAALLLAEEMKKEPPQPEPEIPAVAPKPRRKPKRFVMDLSAL